MKRFKITDAVSSYDVIKMMAEAWDTVSKTAILSRWKTVGILAPFQQHVVITTRISMDVKRDSSIGAYSNNNIFSTDRTANNSRSPAARILGAEFLKKNTNGNLSINKSCAKDHSEGNNGFMEYDMNDLRSEIALLKNMERFEVIDVTFLDSFFDTEENEPIF